MSKVDQNRKLVYVDDLQNAIRDDWTIRGDAFGAVMKHIYSAPAADAAPVVHGRWIKTPGDFECSACGSEADFVTKYCSDCGAIMDLPMITKAAAEALERMGVNAHGGETPELVYGSSPCVNLPRRKETEK